MINKIRNSKAALYSIVAISLFFTACNDDDNVPIDEPDDQQELVRNPDGIKVGPQEVESTPLEKGTLFVSPAGDGDCSQANPCGLTTAKGKAAPGSVIFLADGVYPVGEEKLFFDTNGSENSTITYESLPDARAIFDGSSLPDNHSTVVIVSGEWNVLRNLTFRNFPENGLRITGNNNLLDGIIAHDNKSSGIHIWGTYDFPYGANGSWNTIQNSVLFNNSDAGLSGGNYNDGGNADGISVSSGEGNEMINNLVYDNSDDGIDVWRSTNSIIVRNVVHSNGKGSNGDGNGIKAGGASPGEGAVVYRNLSYLNRSNGFDHNGSPGVTFHNNTSFKNSRGFVVGEDNSVINNISYQDSETISGTSNQISHNSWQLNLPDPGFESTDPDAEEFLWLSKESRAIDAGKDVDLPFFGEAPDLGAIEF